MILSALIWGPILGAVAVALIPNSDQGHRPRNLSLAIAALMLGLTLFLGLQLDINDPHLRQENIGTGYQVLVYTTPWG